MSEAASTPGPSLLQVGVVLALVAMAISGIAGVIAVGVADSDAGGFGIGIGIGIGVFVVGGTIATALACLRRRRAEIAALVGVVVAGVTIDLIALAAWLEIDDEAYLKVMGIAIVWTVFALVVLSLALGAGTAHESGRPLYLVTSATAVLSGLIATWLIATAGASASLDSIPKQGLMPSTGSSTTTAYGVGSGIHGEWLLRALGVLLVLMAALWFATLAVSRLEQSRA